MARFWRPEMWHRGGSQFWLIEWLDLRDKDASLVMSLRVIRIEIKKEVRTFCQTGLYLHVSAYHWFRRGWAPWWTLRWWGRCWPLLIVVTSNFSPQEKDSLLEREKETYWRSKPDCWSIPIDPKGKGKSTSTMRSKGQLEVSHAWRGNQEKKIGLIRYATKKAT